MKAIVTFLALLVGLSTGVLSQKNYMRSPPVSIKHTAQRDLIIRGTYRIDADTSKVCVQAVELRNSGKSRIQTCFLTHKYYLTVTITNPYTWDYKDITYDVQFIAGDGTLIGTQNYVVHRTIYGRTSLSLGEQCLECPVDCKAIAVSVINGTNVDAL
jgi:hypothetical protein